VSSADPQIPIVELLPAFEEETGLRPRPRPVIRDALDERTPQGGELRSLAARVNALGRDKRLRRIGVVGGVAGEGSSTVALGLARALGAEPGRRVLLLELDLEHPSADRELRLEPPATGVARFLEGAEIPVLRRPAAGLWLLSVGGAAHSVKLDRASTRRLPRLLSAADRVFDFVIGDLPPLLPDRQGAELRGHFDALVLVVRARHAPLETLQHAAHLLRRERVLGMVLNAAERSPW
jgi:Mrp family chromosome partitioning ATPase